MTSPIPRPPTGSTNELAKERNRAAAERTITAWIQTSLTLIGFGIAIDRIAGALRASFPTTDPATTTQLASTIGLAFITLGIGILMIGMMQHWIAVTSIEREDYVIMPSRFLNLLAVSAVLGFGSFAVMSILLISLQ